MSALVLLLLSNACDSILEIEPDGVITNDILTTTDGLQQTLDGAYFGLGGIFDGIDGGELLGGDFTIMATLLAHVSGVEIIWDRVNGFPYNNFADKEVLLTNPRVQANWRRAYEVINQVNTVLVNVDNIDDANEGARIEGEALAIRGILYFEMIRLWGPQYGTGSNSDPAIPLLTEPIIEVGDIETPAPATVQAVYDQAETDLQNAVSLLDAFGANGTRLSSGACRAYLARMAMQKGDFGTAQTLADNIIQSGNYSLTSSPIGSFNNSSNSSEDIFAIQQNQASNTGDRSSGTGLAFYYSSLNESGLGAFRVTDFFLLFVDGGPLFSIQDLRGSVDLNVNLGTTSSQITTAFHLNVLNNLVLSPAKYLSSNNVLPVIRLAEIKLIRAEAIFEQNPTVLSATVLQDLNDLRTRAGLVAFTTADLTTTSDVRAAIRLERRRELLFEGQHLHDLKRWDGAIGITNPVSALDDRFILPIPQAELDTGTGG